MNPSNEPPQRPFFFASQAPQGPRREQPAEHASTRPARPAPQQPPAHHGQRPAHHGQRPAEPQRLNEPQPGPPRHVLPQQVQPAPPPAPQPQGPRWSQLTHASFGAPVGNGWGFGPDINAHPDDAAVARRYVRGSIEPVDGINDFLSEEQIAQLPVRFEYIPTGSLGLYLHSKPAGSDSTGRTGNTFTHVFIDHDTSAQTQLRYPVLGYGSSDFKTPFGSDNVNGVELTVDNDGPNPGTFDLQWAWVVVRQMLDAEGVIYAVQDVLANGQTVPVIATKNSVQSTAWIMVLSCTMTALEARCMFRFSTFERADSLDARSFEDGLGSTVLAAPVEDIEELQKLPWVSVIDPRTDYSSYEPVNPWAKRTKQVVGHFDPGGNGSVEDMLDALESVPQPPPGTVPSRIGRAMRLLQIREQASDQVTAPTPEPSPNWPTVEENGEH